MISFRRRLAIGGAFIVAGALVRLGLFPDRSAEAAAPEPTRAGTAKRSAKISARVPAFLLPANIPNVFDWNMCGGVSNCSSNMDNPWLEAWYSVYFSPTRPRAATFQEICRDQFSNLNAYMQTLGYTGQKYYSNHPNSACHDHGNAVFWKGGNAYSASAAYSNVSGESDVRGWVCGQAQNPAYLACSTHLAANNDNIALSQAGEYRDQLNWKNANRGKTYGGGDFNLTPGQGVNSKFGGAGYVEGAPSALTWHAGNGLQDKLDYVWVPSFNHWCMPYSGGSFENHWGAAQTSDHLQYWAYANLC